MSSGMPLNGAIKENINYAEAYSVVRPSGGSLRDASPPYPMACAYASPGCTRNNSVDPMHPPPKTQEGSWHDRQPS